MFSSLGYTKVKVLFKVERNPVHSYFHFLRVGQHGQRKTLKCCLSEPSLFPKLAMSLVVKFP